MFGCNTSDNAKQGVTGEVEFFFSTLKEIVEENLHPIKKYFEKEKEADMMIEWKKAKSERTANLRAWKQKRAEQKRERKFRLEQIRNVRPEDREASGDDQDYVNDSNTGSEDREPSGDYHNGLNGEKFFPPLCENDRDRELLEAKAPRRKGQSSNTNMGRPQSALVSPPGECQGESPKRNQSTKEIWRERNHHTVSMPGGGAFDGIKYLDDMVPEKGLKTSRDSFEVTDTSHWQKAGGTTTEVHTNPEGLSKPTASIPGEGAFDGIKYLDDMVPEKGLKTRDSFEVTDTSHWQKAGETTTEFHTNPVCLSDADFWADIGSKKATATRTSIEEFDTQFGKESRDLKAQRPDVSVGKVDTTLWEEKPLTPKANRVRDAAMEELDRRAWHIF
jgi:hypothetical protein